ncbi:MAG: glycosyltransferase family 4 protein, partial [Pontiella sp.]|nr:glycosyltransferase family 4 protein [Pontiella sp.]
MPRPSKVIHVMRRFSFEKWGGTESVVFNLACEMKKKGIKSRIYCTDMLSAPGIESHDAVEVHRFRYLFPWVGLSKAARKKLIRKGGSPLSLRLFFALLREKNSMLIHTHVQHRLGGMARTAARLKRIPYVVSLHGGHYTLPAEQVEKMVEPFRGRLEWGKLFGALLGSRRVLTDADAIICVGQSEYDAVIKHHPDKRVFHVPNGVDTGRFSRADGDGFRKAYGIGPSEKIVLCVSRIDYQKNQLGLVRAFAAFSARHPDHRLVLIGPVTVESYRDELLAEIERLGVKRKTILVEGLRPDDPLLAGAYRAAEMFVLPSVHEPFGIVVLEAWASGVPVIASRVGGIPGFAADRKNILMFEPGNDGELAEHMEELAESAATRAALSKNAFNEVTTHYD